MELWRTLRSWRYKTSGEDYWWECRLTSVNQYLSGEGWVMNRLTKKINSDVLDRSDNPKCARTHSPQRNVCLYILRCKSTSKRGIRDHYLIVCAVVMLISFLEQVAQCRGEWTQQFDWSVDCRDQYQCTDCPHTYRVRAHDEDRLPHSLSVVTCQRVQDERKKDLNNVCSASSSVVSCGCRKSVTLAYLEG